MNEIAVPAGKYVVAVSGGVDSMVLLDILARRPELELVVAHFDHGIRLDAAADRQLVEKIAIRYQLPFVTAEGKLAPTASEATARAARYAFLRQVRQEQGAQAIITAHHQDDLLETMVLNIMRGTGRKGLSSLGSSEDDILRPLLHVPKTAIHEYVRSYPDVIWHEDSTNSDERYLRNYIRRKVIPRLSGEDRAQLLAYAARASQANPAIDALIGRDIAAHSGNEGLSRSWFIALPYAVSCEAMASWLRLAGIADFDRKAIEALVVTAKTAAPGKRRDINAERLLNVTKTTLQLLHRSTS
jgi:tRNA(Ile)-lysidine synthetase-like protein